MGWNVPRQLQCHFCLCMVQYSPSSHSNLQDHGSRPFPWSSRFREIRSNASCFGTRSLCNRWHSTDDTFLILGLVRAPIMTTLIQVFSRIFIVWGIVPLFPDSVQDSYAYPIMLLAWSVTEVIRYSFYAWNILDEVPYFLLWLRYQYLGFRLTAGTRRSGYCIQLVSARSFGRWLGRWRMRTLGNLYMPRSLWGLYLDISLVSPLLYLSDSGFYSLFTHMIRQRRKVLGKARGKKSWSHAKNRMWEASIPQTFHSTYWMNIIK